MAIKVRRNGAWVDNTGEKKRVNGSWVSNEPYKVMKPYISGVPPFTFKSDGEDLRDWSMSGQTVQASTPSPANPVAVEGVGMRTGNLFSSSFSANYNINTSGEVVPYTLNASRCATLTPIDVSNFTTVTFSFTNTSSNDTKLFIYALFDGSTLVSREASKASGNSINVSQGNKLYLCIYSNDTTIDSSQTISDIMLNTGSTALPYEPYGWCIEIEVT